MSVKEDRCLNIFTETVKHLLYSPKFYITILFPNSSRING